MTQVQLDYVLAVMREKNFGRAAKACNVTQPTLSAQIQKLEENLGVTIFDRSKSPVRPTRLGELVIEQAKKAHNEFVKIRDIVDQEKGVVKGRFTLGAIPTISPYLIPRILKKLRDQFPLLELEVYELTTENCLKALDAEEIDMAVIATKENRHKYRQTIIGSEPMYLMKSPDDEELKELPSKVCDLNPKNLWLLEEGHCLRDEIVEACKFQKMQNIKPQGMVFKTGSIQALMNIVRNFGGYTLIPEMAYRFHESEIKDDCFRINPMEMNRTIYTAVKRSEMKKQSVESISQLLRNALN